MALKPEDGQALLVQAEAEAAAASRTRTRTFSSQRWRGPGGRRRARALRAQSVRDGIRDEVRQDVMAQARSEAGRHRTRSGWVDRRIKVTGDMRVRSDRAYSERNSDIVSNWSSINSGNGFDTNTNLQLPPLLNTRTPQRIRAPPGHRGHHRPAHHGRRAPGQRQQHGPVSTTEQLGGEQKDVWLDQAWLAPVRPTGDGARPAPAIRSGPAIRCSPTT